MLGGLDYHSVAALIARALARPANVVGVVDTVATLKAMPAPVGSPTYVVRGFASAGDGGGGVYWWNSGDTSADNGGTVIQLDAGGVGRFVKLF